jgi:hypothetical protein
MTYLTRGSQEGLRRLIEEHTDYRAGLVSTHQGWIGGHYVFGDGEVASGRDSTDQVLVAFEPDEKFAAHGRLNDWIDAVHPLVEGQRLPLFVLAYAFIGPLMRFAPPEMLNPIVELVGESGTGKSTLGVLASSVWGGRPGSDVGGGESWSLTLASLDQVKRHHSDCHLTLDEGNLLGDGQQKLGDSINRAVFMLASTEEKRRFGDTGPRNHIRLATLSTTNLPLAELVNASQAVAGALAQRMITVRVVGEHGVLDTIPNGLSSARSTIESIRRAADENYGVAGREFIRRLLPYVATHNDELRASIGRRMAHYEAFAREEAARTPARVTKTFAMTFGGGSLAQKCGLIPGEAKDLLWAIRSIHAAVDSEPRPARHRDPLQRIRDYVRSNWDALVAADRLERPLTRSEFEESEGFWRAVEGGTEILIPSPRFQQVFTDSSQMMRALVRRGVARTEGGNSPKLTIKTPQGICRAGRVYCVRLPESPSAL